MEHPAVMTHASLDGSGFEVPDDLVRLSVGIEHIDDLLADLERMVAAAARAAPRDGLRSAAWRGAATSCAATSSRRRPCRGPAMARLTRRQPPSPPSDATRFAHASTELSTLITSAARAVGAGRG